MIYRWSGLLFSAVFIFVSCTHTVTVSPVDEESGEVIQETEVKKNDTPVGTGVTTLEIDRPTTITLEPGPEWFSKNFSVNENTPETIDVSLRRNYFYRRTTQDTNDVANKWLNIQVSENMQEDREWWSTVVNALLSADYELERMEKSSGYIRTSWMTVQLNEWKARRRFRGNIVDKDPLKWRIRYEIEVKKGGIYKPVSGRVFLLTKMLSNKSEHKYHRKINSFDQCITLGNRGIGGHKKNTSFRKKLGACEHERDLSVET